ncbi:MAG: sulfate reduction electron transfer complex DsrMKJOP subunit DsrO [Pseudomonadota bacterium]
MSDNPFNIEVRPARREFIKKSAALAFSMIAPGVVLYKAGQAKSPEEIVSDKQRWGLLIDTREMTDTDVDASVAACQKEHGWGDTGNPKTDAQWIRKVTLTDASTGHRQSLPMMCQHCENPPCVDVCPTGASFKRADGIVLVNKHTCIGCRYCMMACPFKARSFIHENLRDQLPVAPRGKGTVESCTLCVHRIDRDGADAVPACAEAVNREDRQAIVFGDLNDPDSNISIKLREFGGRQLRADLGLNAAVHFKGI